ncbi:uncharacterized protein LOC107038996 [Diachasma alloeum]|uniref:uncharacterized protein LOC107038996 n=1 Tax=Diachasma alloeum TaxID=454923 RepID=UPI00073841BE|nr:uncharacterized protein LOC107038996 [Diachasma alloeum]
MSGRKRSQSRVTDAMKEELLKWLCIQHATNGPLNRDILRQKANELVRHFELTSFKCSESWLTLFLKRYHFTTNLSEGVGPLFDDFHTWVTLIRGLINQYSYEDQYHLDELTMYTDFLPCSQLQLDEVPDAPVDMSTLKLQLTTPAMHQTTILLVCNATATQKQKPLVCGPYPAQDNETYTYIQNSSSRISDEILSAYLFMLNRRIAESNRVILLFMSRTRINVLKLVHLTHILPVFLPYRFPSHLKPLRQDVAHSIKMSYRKSYVSRLCSPDASHWTPQEISETLVNTWLQLPRETIVVRFQRTKFRDDDSFTSFECPEWEGLETGVPFERFVTFDDHLGETVGPLRDDFRFLTNVKHKFNLKPSRIPVEDFQGSESQPSTSGGLGGLERPLDDADEGQDEARVPVEARLPVGISANGGDDPHRDSGDQVNEAEMPVADDADAPQEPPQESENPSGTAEEINSSINCLSSETSLNQTDDVATPVRKLFENDSSLVAASESIVQFEDTMSLNSVSRGESTMTEEFDSTLDNSLAPGEDPEGTASARAADSVDSGVPDSSGGADHHEEVDVSSSMEVEAPGTPPRTSGLSADVSFSTSSVKNDDEDEGNEDDSSTAVLTPLVNVEVEDGASPGAALAAEFISDPSREASGLGEVLDTSAEGRTLTAEAFVDERIKYFVSTVDEEQAEAGGDGNDEAVPSEGLGDDESTEAVDKEPEDSELEDKEDISEGNTAGPADVGGHNGIDEVFSDDSTQEAPPPLPHVTDKAGISGEIIVNNFSVDNTIADSEGQPLEVSETVIIETMIKVEARDNDPGELAQMRALTTTPVVQDQYVLEKTSYSTESALQEASRELEEKLRDLEASDPSRKISSFFDDEDTSESSKQSIEAASLLRDLLNEAKGLSETSGFSQGKYLLGEGEPINYYRGKRRREGQDEGEPDKKKQMQENWAKCFENFPAFGPYNFEEGDDKRGNFGAEVSAEIEVKSEETCGFGCSEETPGPSCSYKKC